MKVEIHILLETKNQYQRPDIPNELYIRKGKSNVGFNAWAKPSGRCKLIQQEFFCTEKGRYSNNSLK